jgi:uncharacterized protein (TIGR02677 family)
MIHREVREIVFYNTGRTEFYRPIIRYLLVQRKRTRYALASEEVHAFIRNTYPALGPYSLEDCEQDLLRLDEFGAVKIEQQRGRVNTVEEFRKRRLKVQIGAYAMQVEEALIAVEQDRSVRGSLDSSWLDSILLHLKKIHEALASGIPPRKEDRRAVWGDWKNAYDAFQRMGDNANTFYAPFYETRVLDLIDSETFLKYKERLIDYIQNFGERLMIDAGAIRGRLEQWEESGTRERLLTVIVEAEFEETEVAIAQSALRGERKAPARTEEVREFVEGQYVGFQEWFAEGGTYRTLSNAATYAIGVIVGFARRIANEGRVPAARQREWERLSDLFRACTAIDEAHRLAGVALGCSIPRHLFFDNHRMHDRDSAWEQVPHAIQLKVTNRNSTRSRPQSTPIPDDSAVRARVEDDIRSRMALERQLWAQLFKEGGLSVLDLELEDPRMRDLLVDVIGRCLSTAERSTEGPDGTRVLLLAPDTPDQYGEIRCTDGVFITPAYRLDIAPPTWVHAST